MDAITLLKNDHKEVKALFRQFEQAKSGKRKIVDKIIESSRFVIPTGPFLTDVG